MSTRADVVVGGGRLFTADVEGLYLKGELGAHFSADLSLSEGEILDFIVGPTPNGSANDTTGLEATITADTNGGDTAARDRGEAAR